MVAHILHVDGLKWKNKIFIKEWRKTLWITVAQKTIFFSYTFSLVVAPQHNSPNAFQGTKIWMGILHAWCVVAWEQNSISGCSSSCNERDHFSVPIRVNAAASGCIAIRYKIFIIFLQCNAINIMPSRPSSQVQRALLHRQHNAESSMQFFRCHSRSHLIPNACNSDCLFFWNTWICWICWSMNAFYIGFSTYSLRLNMHAAAICVAYAATLAQSIICWRHQHQ